MSFGFFLVFLGLLGFFGLDIKLKTKVCLGPLASLEIKLQKPFVKFHKPLVAFTAVKCAQSRLKPNMMWQWSINKRINIILRK